jgi:PKD repeat protein
LTANDSGNVSITVDASSVGVAATNASDGGGTVTVYLRARTVARHQSLARTNLVVAGRPATLYGVAAAPSTDNETWLAFTVTAGEVQTASFRQSTVNFTATLPDPTAVGIPTDPNGDGLYEDLDGDGTQSYNDVVVLFRVLLSDEIQANAAAVDFNGNGRVDFDDVVTLFQGV